MSRIANIVNWVLFIAAVVSFALGIRALGARQDLSALYWLVIGALSLKAAVDMQRPRSAPR
jgi:hypothetical protein